MDTFPHFFEVSVFLNVVSLVLHFLEVRSIVKLRKRLKTYDRLSDYLQLLDFENTNLKRRGAK